MSNFIDSTRVRQQTTHPSTTTTVIERGPGGAPPPISRPPRLRSQLASLFAQRSLRLFCVAWLAATALTLVIGRGGLPFDRPALADTSLLDKALSPSIGGVEILFLMAIVYALTRGRAVPDLAARAPERAIALRETVLVIGYGALGQIGGLVLGRALGWHAFSFHLVGTLYGTHAMVERAEVFAWAGYNFIVYAVAPFLFFRRRYSAEALNLRSSNQRNDVLVIAVVLFIESCAQLFGFSDAILHLEARQLLLGAPLTFAVYFVGTVLPTMIFIYCILVPRYLRLTGSTVTTVILGGVTYMLLHFFEGWTVFTSPRNIALSVIFLFLQYVGPGMFKTFLTLRTGNAWVHVWAYHAFAPHTLEDTPLVVKIFHIK